MTLATKNGALIVKDGSIAENCNCCGGWYCYTNKCQFTPLGGDSLYACGEDQIPPEQLTLRITYSGEPWCYWYFYGGDGGVEPWVKNVTLATPGLTTQTITLQQKQIAIEYSNANFGFVCGYADDTYPAASSPLTLGVNSIAVGPGTDQQHAADGTIVWSAILRILIAVNVYEDTPIPTQVWQQTTPACSPSTLNFARTIALIDGAFRDDAWPQAHATTNPTLSGIKWTFTYNTLHFLVEVV